MDVPIQPSFVPVCTSNAVDTLTIRTGRRPRGSRVGIAFTRSDRLAAAMGDQQRWIRLSESALRAALRPLGISGIQVDPILVGPGIARSAPQLAAPMRPAAVVTAGGRVDAVATPVTS